MHNKVYSIFIFLSKLIKCQYFIRQRTAILFRCIRIDLHAYNTLFFPGIGEIIKQRHRVAYVIFENGALLYTQAAISTIILALYPTC